MTDAPGPAEITWIESESPAGTVARLALHHLHPVADAAPLLVSHATGFHARAYRSVAQALGTRFDVWGIDHRGHGASPLPAGWRADWRDYGADTLAASRWLAERAGAQLVGFGHSMGGATLLIAAHQAPELFAGLVVYEPIAYPPGSLFEDPEDFPLVAGARRRRAHFESYEAAYANYASKLPLALLRPDVLRDYVDHGFRPSDGQAGVELCCAPDHEGDTFAASASNGVWEELPDVGVPATVIGSGDTDGPALIAPHVAERLPAGRFVHQPNHTHFGPLSDPDEVAALVSEAAPASRPL